MTPTNRHHLENILFFVAFIIALALRLIRLDLVPISNFEANFALQALGIARNAHPALTGSPAYVLPTAALFFVFGSADFWVRFLPAITGSMLVFVPYLFRDKFPVWSAVTLAFLLAIDPGLVAISRGAGSPIMAVTFTLLALGLWRNRYHAWAGFFGALALLSGPALWPGLIGLGIAYLATGGAGWMHPPFELDQVEGESDSGRDKWKRALISGGATLLGAGTLFFLSPNGLGALIASLPDYLRGWFTPGDVPIWRPLIVLSAYHIFVIGFAVASIVRGVIAKSRMTYFLAAWALAELVLVLIYPARQVADLAWMLVPLAALASLEIGRAFEWDDAEKWETVGMAVLTFAVLVFAYLDFLSLALNSYAAEEARMRWVLFGGAFILLGLSILLVAIGWSATAARRGALFGIIAVMTLYTINVTTGTSGMRSVPTQSPWRADPQTGQAVAMLKTIEDLSTEKTGDPNGLDVVVYNVESPALRWLLRDKNARFTQGLTAGDTPAIVIGPLDPNAVFASSYRGQDFIWQVYPGWNSMVATDWLKWVAAHNTAAGQDQVILWARTDLFLDSQDTTP